MLITALLDNGNNVEISEAEGGNINIYAWPTGKHRPEAFSRWVKVVPGNNPGDFINDYTNNLSRIVNKVRKFAEKMS